MMFYCKSTNGFYDQEIHGDNIPEDKVEISAEYHSDLMAGQAEGKIIASDDRGYPRLQEQPPMTSEQLQQANNNKARKYLADTDWYVIRQMDEGTPIPEEIKAKRADARASIVE